MKKDQTSSIPIYIPPHGGFIPGTKPYDRPSYGGGADKLARHPECQILPARKRS